MPTAGQSTKHTTLTAF